MARQRQYIDVDVLTAARERIRHIFDLHDTVAVCFSGGKDSLTALHLTREIALERGQEQVNVIFRDEELIPQSVIDFVDEYRQLPWVKMLYFAVPLASTKYVLGRSFDYVQWDRNRLHLRAVPEHAITLPQGDERVFDQYTMDAFAASYYTGKIAFITGIRASESIIRFRASVNKLNENYITASSAKNVWLAKPLYDWEENDIFRYFYEQGIRYCSLYDQELVAGAGLRVSTPLHPEAAKRLDVLATVDPVFYRQVTDLFPEMLVQARYYRELDRDAIIKRYGQDLEGVKSYILENIEDEEQLHKALSMFESVAGRHRRMPESYPAPYILKYFMAGGFKRELIPLGAPR